MLKLRWVFTLVHPAEAFVRLSDGVNLIWRVENFNSSVTQGLTHLGRLHEMWATSGLPSLSKSDK